MQSLGSDRSLGCDALVVVVPMAKSLSLSMMNMMAMIIMLVVMMMNMMAMMMIMNMMRMQMALWNRIADK